MHSCMGRFGSPSRPRSNMAFSGVRRGARCGFRRSRERVDDASGFRESKLTHDHASINGRKQFRRRMKMSRWQREGMRRGIRLFVLGTVLALISASSIPAVFAQSDAINGTVRGRVSDASDASIDGATVTIHNSANGLSRSTKTGADGYYVFPNLPLGTYDVVVTKDGFAIVRASKVLLEAGKEAVIDAHLPLASVSTTVEVSGGAPLIEPTRVNVGRTIDTKEIENLPLTSRNPYNFILFQPGVSGHPNPELGIPRTINTNGLLDRINYQMDGMVDTETDRYGLRLFPIADIYVQEVQTVSNSFAPEFGF